MTERRWAFMSRKVIGYPDNPMLIRWRVIQTPWGGLYVHFIHREDLDRMPHDHPWTFWTFVLRGYYREHYWPDTRTLRPRDLQSNVRGPFSFRRFPMQAAHRIVEIEGKVTTLVIVGPKTRTWGFYASDGTFIDWRDYHNVTKKDVW